MIKQTEVSGASTAPSAAVCMLSSAAVPGVFDWAVPACEVTDFITYFVLFSPQSSIFTRIFTNFITNLIIITPNISFNTRIHHQNPHSVRSLRRRRRGERGHLRRRRLSAVRRLRDGRLQSLVPSRQAPPPLRQAPPPLPAQTYRSLREAALLLLLLLDRPEHLRHEVVQRSNARLLLKNRRFSISYLPAKPQIQKGYSTFETRRENAR